MAGGRMHSHSPWRRRWAIFRQNRRGFYSLVLFLVLFGLSLFAEVLSNDKPLLIGYQGSLYLPLWRAYPETVFGGDFETETDYRDPYIRERLTLAHDPAYIGYRAAVLEFLYEKQAHVEKEAV